LFCKVLEHGIAVADAVWASETERMPDNGTSTFNNPVDYQARIADAQVNLVVTGGGDFKARLTWLKLRHLRVLRGCENLPRVAYISLSPDRVFVSFAASGSPSIWAGLELRIGDIVFHGRGERTHYRTTGESKWGLLSLPPDRLAACGKALTGMEIISPPSGRLLRPSRIVAARLLRLHSKACHLAETRHEIVECPEVTRALEQELLHALINCLTADEVDDNVETRRHHASLMGRLEDELARNTVRQLTIPELCAAIDVPERTLRVCCAEFLGVSPSRYLLLRRLNMARAALRRADPATASVAAIARAYQFEQPGRFAVTYRQVFGEAPSTTLRRAI
jgi:AraC-like DNA-binding protein